MTRELFKDMAKYVPVQIVPAIVGLVSIPIITSLFNPEEYGNYILVIATVSLLSLIPGSLLGDSSVRFFSAYKNQSKLGLFYNTLIKMTAVCVISIAIMFFSILQVAKSNISSNLYYLMSIGIFLFVGGSLFAVLLCLLNAEQKAIAYSCFDIWRVGAGLAFGVALVFLLGRGVDGLLWGSIGALAIAIPLLYYVAIGKMPTKKNAFSKSIATEMTKYGGPLIIVNLAGWILSLSDRYILQLYWGSYEIGLYSASYAVSEKTLMMLTSLFMLAGYPQIVSIWESKGKDATQDFVGELTRYYLLAAFPVALGLSVLSRPVISIFTAPDYYEGYKIVPLVAFGVFLLGLQWWAQIGLALYKRTNIIMYSILGAGLLNIGLNILIVPKYSYIGAAVTTLLSYAFLLAVMLCVSKKYFVWSFPFKSLGKVATALTVMAVIVYPIGNSMTSSSLINLILGIGIGMIVYFLMLLILRELQKEEIEALLKCKSKLWRVYQSTNKIKG